MVLLAILALANDKIKGELEKKEKEVETLERMIIEETDKGLKLQKQIENLNNTINEKEKHLQEKDRQLQSKAKARRVGTGDCYEAMKKYFPQSQWENASMVITKESGGRSNAVSPTDDHGCFQINKGLANHGQKIYDADYNAGLAYNHFYVNRGWTPWYAVRGILW